MHEIWKDIKGYEGLYQISNLGNVKSFVSSSRYNNEPHLLKQHIGNNGYPSVSLYISKGKKRGYLIHKLVADAFLENPNNYPCVNHKDENKLNNKVNNLEWCTYSYNNAYGTARIRSVYTKNPKRVAQYTIDGYWIATYLSVTIASKITQIGKVNIRSCCDGKMEFANGYIWKYITSPNNTAEPHLHYPTNHNNHRQ